MKTVKDYIEELQTLKLNLILELILAFLLFLIVSGTIISFANGKARPGKNLRNTEPTPQQVNEHRGKQDTEYASYTGIGRVRTQTKDNIPLVITSWFSYTAGDNEFYEELSRKNGILTGIIKNYFQQFTEKQLKLKEESQIKNELKTALNKELSLNKIEEVYFSEYVFFN